MVITFQNESISFALKDKLLLRRWIAEVVKREGHQTDEINYLFTSDENVLAYNKQYLNHNTYTDIITFDNGEEGGDIIISTERVNDNANKFNVTFEQELHRVMIHGILHLCGYKDKKASDASVMRSKEDEYLRLFERLKKSGGKSTGRKKA